MDNNFSLLKKKLMAVFDEFSEEDPAHEKSESDTPENEAKDKSFLADGEAADDGGQNSLTPMAPLKGYQKEGDAEAKKKKVKALGIILATKMKKA